MYWINVFQAYWKWRIFCVDSAWCNFRISSDSDPQAAQVDLPACLGNPPGTQVEDLNIKNQTKG